MAHLVALLSNIAKYINRLGRDGNCESLIGFTQGGALSVTISPTQVKNGSKSFKVAPSSQDSFVYKDYTYPIDTLKQYIVGAWIYIESFASGGLAVRIWDVGGFINLRYAVPANTATVGSWQFVYAKIPTANTLLGTGFRVQIGTSAGSMTAVAYFDGIRLYELSAAEYAAIGTIYTTDTQVDSFIPYVDSI